MWPLLCLHQSDKRWDDVHFVINHTKSSCSSLGHHDFQGQGRSYRFSEISGWRGGIGKVWADQDSKWLSIDLCTKCPFIWGGSRGGAGHLTEGLKLPPPHPLLLHPEHSYYSLIAFDERVTFWLQRVRSLPYAYPYVALFSRRLAYNHYAIAHAYNAETHTRKAVTGSVEAKKLLTRRRQSEYRLIWMSGQQGGSGELTATQNGSSAWIPIIYKVSWGGSRGLSFWQGAQVPPAPFLCYARDFHFTIIMFTQMFVFWVHKLLKGSFSSSFVF